MRLYCVGALRESCIIEDNIFGQRAEMPMTWAVGMIGALPVFKTMEDAEKYADGRYQITPFDMPDKVLS